MPWDKAEHFTAFYGLTLLGMFAFPNLRVVFLAIGLSLAGAAVEALQATSLVQRDADVLDWVADTLGIAAATVPLWAPRWRRWLKPQIDRSAAVEFEQVRADQNRAREGITTPPPRAVRPSRLQS